MLGVCFVKEKQLQREGVLFEMGFSIKYLLSSSFPSSNPTEPLVMRSLTIMQVCSLKKMFQWIWKCCSLDFFAKHEHWDLAGDQNIVWIGGRGGSVWGCHK